MLQGQTGSDSVTHKPQFYTGIYVSHIILIWNCAASNRSSVLVTGVATDE